MPTAVLQQSGKQPKERCINIDWLEVYCLEDIRLYPCDAAFFRAKGWQVLEREYGTRVYAQMFTLLDTTGQPMFEIRRAPLSDQAKDGGLFPSESCHIRVTNQYCYHPDIISLLRQFLARYNYQLKRIFRLDICLDFIEFDRHDDPARFVARYMAGKYSKINQSNISAHGTDQWSQRCWNSLSWGRPKSMVSTKLYCKSLELQQVHDKPYIRLAWFTSHLVDDPINLIKYDSGGNPTHPDIWRVEFSIKSSAKHWFIVERSTGKKGKIGLPHTLDQYDTPQKLLTAFASLAQHYFHFKHYQEGVRKDRCQDKILFDFSPLDLYYRLDRLVAHTSKMRPLDRLISIINNYRETHHQPDIKAACDVILNSLRNERLNVFTGSPRESEILRILLAERIPLHDKPDLIAHRRIIEETLDFFDNPDTQQSVQ